MREIQERIGSAGQAEFVKLVTGKPLVVKIKEVSIQSWQMTEPDPNTGDIKTLTGLQFEVTEENGKQCSKTLRMTSKRFINSIAKDLEAKLYLKKNLRLTKFGEKYDTEYEFEWVTA
jgi:hypothetical protein